MQLHDCVSTYLFVHVCVCVCVCLCVCVCVRRAAEGICVYTHLEKSGK